MKKIIDAKDMVLGRLASLTAKMALKGDEVVILNCEKAIITGNIENIKKRFLEKRGRVGSGQQGPKHSRLNEEIVKRTIRGMLPNHRTGRGKEALKRIKCYVGIPKEFDSSEKMKIDSDVKRKFIQIEEIYKE